MALSIHHRIKMLIEETNDAFAHCRGSINSDYAEFATMSLPAFKQALRKPELTGHDLTNMLRSGTAKHKHVDPECCWATFMAHYIARTSNAKPILQGRGEYVAADTFSEPAKKEATG